MAYSVLKSAGCVPEEVELLSEIGALAHTLAARRLRLALALERARQKT